MTMGEGPPGSPIRRRPQTTASCAGTTAGVVSVAEKAPGEGVRYEPEKANESKPPMKRREQDYRCQNRELGRPRDELGGHLESCPSDIRRTGGASPAQASAWNVRSCAPIQRRRKATVEVDRPTARGRAHKRRTRKGQSTDAEAQWRTAP